MRCVPAISRHSSTSCSAIARADPGPRLRRPGPGPRHQAAQHLGPGRSARRRIAQRLRRLGRARRQRRLCHPRHRRRAGPGPRRAPLQMQTVLVDLDAGDIEAKLAISSTTSARRPCWSRAAAAPPRAPPSCTSGGGSPSRPRARIWPGSARCAARSPRRSAATRISDPPTSPSACPARLHKDGVQRASPSGRARPQGEVDSPNSPRRSRPCPPAGPGGDPGGATGATRPGPRRRPDHAGARGRPGRLDALPGRQRGHRPLRPHGPRGPHHRRRGLGGDLPIQRRLPPPGLAAGPPQGRGRRDLGLHVDRNGPPLLRADGAAARRHPGAHAGRAARRHLADAGRPDRAAPADPGWDAGARRRAEGRQVRLPDQPAGPRRRRRAVPALHGTAPAARVLPAGRDPVPLPARAPAAAPARSRDRRPRPRHPRRHPEAAHAARRPGRAPRGRRHPRRFPRCAAGHHLHRSHPQPLRWRARRRRRERQHRDDVLPAEPGGGAARPGRPRGGHHPRAPHEEARASSR